MGYLCVESLTLRFSARCIARVEVRTTRNGAIITVIFFARLLSSDGACSCRRQEINCGLSALYILFRVGALFVLVFVLYSSNRATCIASYLVHYLMV